MASQLFETKGTNDKHSQNLGRNPNVRKPKELRMNIDKQKLGWRFNNEKPKKQPPKLRQKPKIASPRSETKGTNFENRQKLERRPSYGKPKEKTITSQ